MADGVGDEEQLFRSVSPSDVGNQNGKIFVSSSAFHDPKFKPSVDRAALCNGNPLHTRRAEGDGVCRLLARRIREIAPADVADTDAKGLVILERRVDVVPDPIPDGNDRGLPANLAHALIITSPQISKNQGAWRRVRAALARIATEGGFALPPAP